MNIYWGDIHNHCEISYGYGSLDNALSAAKEQLDFCGITGHAMWPDIPRRTEKLEYLIDFHEKGFKNLSDNWDAIRKKISESNKPNEFVTFQTYEIHSRKYGDYHVVSPDDSLPLQYADSPMKLAELLEDHKSILVPHHISYAPGYRGINWEEFNEDISPIVEVFSKHGCSMHDTDVYPYLHTMGPRDSRSCVHTGLKMGYKFAFSSSTDHHAGYPGAYGDGRLAVFAESKTRESIWEAIRLKRVYAVTGDRIKCYLRINDCEMGGELFYNGIRQIELKVFACDFIDKIVVFKNTLPWKVLCGENIRTPIYKSKIYKLRVEMGWGKSANGYKWDGNVKVINGAIKSVEKCFRGQNILVPTPEIKNDSTINGLSNRLIEQTKNNVSWNCTTFKNPSTLHSQTSSLILEVEGDEKTEISYDINNKKGVIPIKKLLEGGYSFHLEEYNSEAFIIHKAVPERKYTVFAEWIDNSKQGECDNYYVEVRQVNNQIAWISPIYVHRSL